MLLLIIFSVYTLWHNPKIVPLLHVSPLVISKLQGGADLMTPGLLGGPPFPTKATKGAIVAIASTDSPSVPLVVGYCEIDISALQKTQGEKGHAVRSITWLGDELWAWSTTGQSGREAPDALDAWTASDNVTDITEQTENLAIADSKNAEEGKQSRPDHDDADTSQERASSDKAVAAVAESQTWTTQGNLKVFISVSASLIKGRN
jgi:translation initiation factor 2D